MENFVIFFYIIDLIFMTKESFLKTSWINVFGSIIKPLACLKETIQKLIDKQIISENVK